VYSRALVVCLFLLGVSTSASAQIYSWRDAEGRLFVSNTKPPAGVIVKSYAVPNTQTVRATRFAAPSKADRFEELIVEHSQRQGVRADLVRAVMQVESAFNPSAISPKGAIGLMQLMPATIRQYGVTNPFDPAQNVGAGVAYLRVLLDRYQNDETLALAAYNAGPTAVDRHGQTIPPYRETRNYVAQISRMVSERPREIASAPNPNDHRIYKVAETIDGRDVPLYTNKRPAAPSTVVGR
jgi:soluble lytic murein transglycosylase-like protein